MRRAPGERPMGSTSPAALEGLEQLTPQAAAGEGSKPGAEHDPLTAGREQEAYPERPDGQRHRRAEEAYRVGDGVPRRGGPAMHPGEEGHVELGERVVVDDVFRDPAKQPQPRDADDEPDGEVEPEVLPARKPCGHERPGARITYLELLEPRCGEDALPGELRTLDHPGAVPLKPAPSERESHAQRNEQHAGQAGLANVVFELRQVAAEHVAERPKNHRPAHRAERVIEHEGAVGHMGRPREHRGPGAQQRDEAADEDRLGTVLLKERMCPRQMRFVEVKDTPIPPHQRDAAFTPNPVAAVVADDGRGDRGRDDRGDREVPERGKGRGGDQGSLAWARDPEALDTDQAEADDVAVGCNQTRYGPMHNVRKALHRSPCGWIPGARSSHAASGRCKNGRGIERSEERRVGKECRSRWSPYH